MKRVLSVLILLTTVVALSAQSSERVDLGAIQKIRDEGLNRSEVMKHLFYMTDVYGPRLQGSPGIEQAGDWVVKTLQSWGMQNVRKERFPFGVGWSLNNFHATMLGAQGMPLIGYPKAWSSGTNGVVRADVVRPQIANAAEAEQWRGKLRGKVVLTQPARESRGGSCCA